MSNTSILGYDPANSVPAAPQPGATTEATLANVLEFCRALVGTLADYMALLNTQAKVGFTSFTDGTNTWQSADDGAITFTTSGPVTIALTNNTLTVGSTATVGATWGVDLNSIPTRFGDSVPGSGSGLVITAAYLGYYTAGVIRSYISSTGVFYVGDGTNPNTDSGAYMYFTPTPSGKVKIRATEGFIGSATDYFDISNHALRLEDSGYVTKIASTGIDCEYIAVRENAEAANYGFVAYGDEATHEYMVIATSYDTNHSFTLNDVTPSYVLKGFDLNNCTFSGTTPAIGSQIATGSYSGNDAATRGITGVGFAPDAVFIIPGDGAIDPFVRIDSMAANAAYDLYAGVIYSASLLSCDADGFTVGTGGGTLQIDLNNSGYTYYYIALKA